MVYDAGDDFSIASNPNGVWSYHQGPSPGSLLTTASGGNTPGWFSSVPSPPFGDFPYVLANRTGQTQNGNWEDGMLLLHPAENGLESVVRFTVPRDDTYTVRGLWRSNSSGATTANVWVNQSNLFGVNLSSAVGDQTFNFTFGGTSGDIVDFAVGTSNDSFGGDAVVLDAQIVGATAVPEPTSIVSTLSGAAGIVWLRRRSHRSKRSFPH